MIKEEQNNRATTQQTMGNAHFAAQPSSPYSGEGQDGKTGFFSLLRASFKSMDTEEWLDIYFTRPIGLAFALFWHRLGVTPNTITILSIFPGIGVGVMFYFIGILYNIIEIILLVLANFCDSTDGQLAQLTRQQSMKDHCLDGFAGDVWFFLTYLATALRLWYQPMPDTSEVWGFWGLALIAIASLLCHSPQSSLSDYYRQAHLYFLKGKEGSELDSYEREHDIVESLKGKKGVVWDRAFHSNYRRYCRSQERRTPAFQKFHAALIEKYGGIGKVPQELKDRFLAGSKPLMPFTNFLSFSSRIIPTYIACLLNCPWIYSVFEISLYSLLYICMHKRHEDLCRSLTPKE